MEDEHEIPSFGAVVEGSGVEFSVWAPGHADVELRVEGGESLTMAPGDDGLFHARVADLGAGARYRIVLDSGPPFPDPASRFQPEGVHGPSEVVDPRAFEWSDSTWDGLRMDELVIYELHVGTFTEEGTFDAARRRLPELVELGVTAVELMPVHDFPGARGWGYDPAAFWAPCRAYGTPDDLRRLVDEAHGLGLAVLLDVVYNHLGPDGAYWNAFGPVLTDRHHTPWGRAVNLDGPGSRGVRDFIVGNALHWLSEYHVDGLRLDATFALVDDSPEHLLVELSRRVETLPGPRRLLIAEDGRNLAELVLPRAEGGYGMDGVWTDDLHHLVRRIVAGDRHGYFAPFPDSTEALAKCIDDRWYLAGGERVATGRDVPYERCVVCIQNHDQIGNRPRGDRLHHGVDLSTYRAAVALLLFVPETPLLFMGQEWAASTPFCYFTDHEPELGRKVSEGRRAEFEDFPGFAGELPDPQARSTFEASVLRREERDRSPHREILRLHADLLAFRRRLGGAVRSDSPRDGLLLVERGRHLLAVCLRGRGSLRAPPEAAVRLHTEEGRYGGSAAPAIESGEVRFAGPAAVLLERA